MSKLSYENKINLYNERKNDCSIRMLSKKYNITVHGVQYSCCLIDKLGIDILRTTKIWKRRNKKMTIFLSLSFVKS